MGFEHDFCDKGAVLPTRAPPKGGCPSPKKHGRAFLGRTKKSAFFLRTPIFARVGSTAPLSQKSCSRYRFPVCFVCPYTFSSLSALFRKTTGLFFRCCAPLLAFLKKAFPLSSPVAAFYILFAKFSTPRHKNDRRGKIFKLAAAVVVFNIFCF